MNKAIYIMWAIQIITIMITDLKKPGRTFFVVGVTILSSVLTVMMAGWLWLLIPLVVAFFFGAFLKTMFFPHTK